MTNDVSRRSAIGTMAAATAAVALSPVVARAGESTSGHDSDRATLRSNAEHLQYDAARVRAGRLKQSVARWCHSRTPLPQLCEMSRDIGLVAIDLLDEADWPVIKQYGLACGIANSFGTIPKGFNRPDLHDELVAGGEALIPKAAAAGVEKIVVFSGNRAGMSDGEGIANCITGLKRLMPTAEKHRVILCMEMLNSKVDHKDYHADRTPWAVEVAKGVNSPSFRLLYDIYHMQIMEGDVIATIKANAPYIAHYHTAGVPGRNEIDDAQELNYKGIAQVIAGLNFTGYFAHEFIPKRDAATSLRAAAQICTV